MTLCDAVKSFGPKITENYRETRFCDFALPDETVGVIDVSAAGNGSRGIAFLADGMIVKLDGDARKIDYRDIRVMEILPSYETPFEDELMISSPSGDIRISDCSLNKFFLRQLISNMSRISLRMSDSDRDALEQMLTSDALDHYAEQLFAQPVKSDEPENSEITEEAELPELPELPEKPSSVTKAAVDRVEAADAVPEIAAAKKAALSAAEPKPLDIPEESIEWLSSPKVSRGYGNLQNPVAADVSEKELNKSVMTAVKDREEPDIEDMSREETMSYLLDSIAEINAPDDERTEYSEQEKPSDPESDIEVPSEEPAGSAQSIQPIQPIQPTIAVDSSASAASPLTREPDSQDIYIHASRSIRGLIEDGRLTMEQVSAAVREQLVEASEVYSELDIEHAQLPAAVKKHARQLNFAADHLTDYFVLGEDIAARVMFFMLYQMLSYTDRIVQTDATKQRLNYFFVRFGAAGMVLSMLDANFE